MTDEQKGGGGKYPSNRRSENASLRGEAAGETCPGESEEKGFRRRGKKAGSLEVQKKKKKGGGESGRRAQRTRRGITPAGADFERKPINQNVTGKDREGGNLQSAAVQIAKTAGGKGN